MTSISSSFSLTTSSSSPFSNITDEISSAVKAGVLSQADATALDSALSTIGTALSKSASDGSENPGDMKSKVDSLISQQVSSGNLSQDQANELEAFFAQGPGGPGDTPPQDSRDTGADNSSGASSETDASASTNATDATSSSDQYQALIAFLANLKASAAQDSGSYSIGQKSTVSTSSSGTLFSTSA